MPFWSIHYEVGFKTLDNGIAKLSLNSIQSLNEKQILLWLLQENSKTIRDTFNDKTNSRKNTLRILDKFKATSRLPNVYKFYLVST